MYGDAMGSTYATVHANTNDSTILTVLKYWYDATFSATEKNQLADVIIPQVQPELTLEYQHILNQKKELEIMEIQV